jgi:putative transposase
VSLDRCASQDAAYYRPTTNTPIVQQRFAQPLKQLIEEHSCLHLLGFNRYTVQRIFQLMRWQVRQRPVGLKPRVQAMPSVAAAPNERWGHRPVSRVDRP